MQYMPQQRSDDEWLAALRDDGSLRQQEAFADLRNFLQIFISRDIRLRAPSLPALASLDRSELESVVDDIVMDALVRIYHNLDKYIGKGNFVDFALITARRIMLDGFRHKQRHTSFLILDDLRYDNALFDEYEVSDKASVESPEDLAIVNGMLDAVYEAIGHDLSENQARIFYGYQFDGLSMDELAKRTGNSQAGVRALYFRARQKIKQRLQEQGYDRTIIDAISEEHNIDRLEKWNRLRSLNRYSDIRFPGNCHLHEPVRLTVQLTRRPQFVEKSQVNPQLLALTPTESEEIQQAVDVIVFVVAENFSINPNWRPMKVPFAQDSEVVEFTLSGQKVGYQIIEVEFYHQAARVGYTVLEVAVTRQVTEHVNT